MAGGTAFEDGFASPAIGGGQQGANRFQAGFLCCRRARHLFAYTVDEKRRFFLLFHFKQDV